MLRLDLVLPAIFEFTVLFIAFIYVLQLRLTWAKSFLYFSVVALPAILLLTFWDQRVAIIYMLVASFIVLYTYTKSFYVLFDLSVVIIIGIFADSASTYLSALLQGELNAFSLLDSSIFLALFAIVVFLYGYFKKKLIDGLQLSLAVQGLVVLIVVVTMIVFYLNTLLPTSDGELRFVQMNITVQLSYFALMLLFFGLLLLNIKKQNAIQRKEIEHEQFTNYMRALEQVNKDMKKFRHDYINILLTMRIFLEKRDLDGLNSYFHEHILTVETQTMQKNRAFSEFENLQIVELKGLLATKYLLAEEMNIPIQIEISSPISSISMDIIDLTRVVGILLDNAIEASTEITQPKINISFSKLQKSIVIIIENKIMQEPPSVSKLFEEGYSTKGDGHGTGLSTVKNILRQYPNVSLVTTIERGWFIQEIEI